MVRHPPVSQKTDLVGYVELTHPFRSVFVHIWPSKSCCLVAESWRTSELLPTFFPPQLPFFFTITASITLHRQLLTFLKSLFSRWRRKILPVAGHLASKDRLDPKGNLGISCGYNFRILNHIHVLEN